MADETETGETFTRAPDPVRDVATAIANARSRCHPALVERVMKEAGPAANVADFMMIAAEAMAQVLKNSPREYHAQQCGAIFSLAQQGFRLEQQAAIARDAGKPS